MSSEDKRGQQPIEMHDGKPFEPGAYENNFALGLAEVHLPPEFGTPHIGKVRRTYDLGDGRLAMIATDNLSAFDVGALTAVPAKGAALTLTSQYWFQATSHFAPNHLLETPHPNIMIVKKAQVIPVEMVIRGYMAESSSLTSVSRHYKEGKRRIYGLNFPDGLIPNQEFPDGPILTPTTKGETDEMLDDESAARIADKLGGDGTYDEMKLVTRWLYGFGRTKAAQAGLILADTKLEFGLDERGNIIVIDELLTPDSSRFWEMEEYQERLKMGQPQIMYDKELVRKWLAERGFKKGQPIPQVPHEFIKAVAPAYKKPYERLTVSLFPQVSEDPLKLHKEINEVMQRYTPKAA